MTQDKTFTFRLPAELLEKLRKSANTNTRSISAEIIHRLLSTFNRRKS